MNERSANSVKAQYSVPEALHSRRQQYEWEILFRKYYTDELRKLGRGIQLA